MEAGNPSLPCVVMGFSRPRFLNFNTIDILGWRLLCWGVNVLCIVGCLAVALASTH